MSTAPTANASSVVVSSSGRVNAQSGRTGSAARRSTSRNTANSTMPAAKMAKLVTEFQSQA